MIKKEINGEHAVVVADAYISYPERLLKKAKEFYSDINRPTTEERDKYVYWKKNEYHFPVVFYMTREGKSWKVVYFNRSAFPRAKFEKTLSLFEPESAGNQVPAGHPPIKK